MAGSDRRRSIAAIEAHPNASTAEWGAIVRRHGGGVPSWERAWRSGVDVTAEPVDSWPDLFRLPALGSHGPEVAARYLAAHAEAVAELQQRAEG